jgi:hypothetical protein
MSLEKKFVHVSFRIPTTLKASLEQEAKRRDINTSALAVQVLAKYISFDMIVERLEAVPLNKTLFKGCSTE